MTTVSSFLEPTSINLYGAAILNFLVMYYAFVIYRKTIKVRKGFLSKTIIFIGISATFFGIHHLGEIWLSFEIGKQISEAIEGVAAIALLIAVYYLYKTSKS